MANEINGNGPPFYRCLPSILLFSNEIFFESDSETDEVEELNGRCFLEEIERMNTMQFKRHFRLEAESFEDLLNKVNVLYEPSNLGHPEISVELGLLISIWYLANIESFRGVAARFQVSKSTAWNAFLRTCKTIVKINRRHRIISWPRHNRAQLITTAFYEKHHIPGILGAIDGCHVKIIAPKVQPNSYINRKGFHSVILQGVCDDKKIFTDVYIGEAGSVHDYRVYLKSDISQIPDEDYPEDSHLIGDLAYKLSVHLLVGFKDNGYLTDQQKQFNNVLAKARVVIENAFALLKGRFRRLKFVEAVTPEHVCLIIYVACILHNLCIMHGDIAGNIVDIQAELNHERANNPNNLLDIDERNLLENRNAERQAVLKRNQIMNALLLQNNI